MLSSVNKVRSERLELLTPDPQGAGGRRGSTPRTRASQTASKEKKEDCYPETTEIRISINVALISTRKQVVQLDVQRGSKRSFYWIHVNFDLKWVSNILLNIFIRIQHTMNDDGYFLLINYETFNPILKHKQEKKIVTRLKINQKISAMFEISIKYYIYTYNVDKHEAIHTLSNDLGNSTSPFSQKKRKRKHKPNVQDLTPLA